VAVRPSCGPAPCLGWTTPPFGYRLDPERPRDAAGVRVEPSEAVLVAQLFDWYLEPQASLCQLAKRQVRPAGCDPDGHAAPEPGGACAAACATRPPRAGRKPTAPRWCRPGGARRRCCRSARAKVTGHARRRTGSRCRSSAIIAEETFARVQAKLDSNQQTAAGNTRHQWLLRALVSCGVGRLSGTVRQTQAGYR
jgi:site-specific DNA recombinase